MLIDDPKTRCIMLRRTSPQLTGPNGLWEKAEGIFDQLPPELRPKKAIKDLKFTFPTLDPNTGEWSQVRNGAYVKFQHMQHVSDKENLQGLELTLIGIDEACQFEWEQIEYAISRLRSPSKHFSRMVMSCNPDNEHKIKDLIEWYLDEDGYPIPEREGITRYFVRRDGDFVWGDTKEELLERFGEKSNPLSFTFVSGLIYDNPVMMEDNPEYVSFLEGLNPVDKAQLLHGCWNVRAQGDAYFNRDSLNKLDTVPKDAIWCRGWDIAYQEVTTMNKDPDFTANVKMGKTRDGRYIIVGQHHENNKDKLLGQYGRFREKSGERERRMVLQGHYDGKDCVIVVPEDPAAGKIVYEQTAKRLTEEGLRCAKDPAPSRTNKLSKFLPFSEAVENGLVYIVESTFDKDSLEALYKELERFTGERSGRSVTKKDD